MSPEPNLAHQITAAFVGGAFDVSKRGAPKGEGWDALPELIAAKRLREEGADDVAIRLFCTFTAAMDRARNARRLWSNAADLFLRTRWAFEPQEIANRSLTYLTDTLKSFGVSQRHGPDARAWQAIARALNLKGSARVVYRAIYEGTGDTAALLDAVKSTTHTEGSLFPFLKGPKVSLIWVRMLVYPGRAKISNLVMLPVAVDVQVRKVTEYLGLTNTKGQPLNQQVRKTIQDAWHRTIEIGGALAPPGGSSMLNDTAAALDPAVWFVGSWGCTFCERHNRQKFPSLNFVGLAD